MIVDNGSTDGTARDRGRARAGALLGHRPDAGGRGRADPRRADRAGVPARAWLSLEPLPDVVVKLDADLSFSPDYFARLLGAFEADPLLGMASGTCYEQRRQRSWRQRHVTDGHVWGASRAYRRRCLEDVQPLESGLAWDGIDELKAAVKGWRTTTCVDAPVLPPPTGSGSRESRAGGRGLATGAMSYYMGYRFGYLVLRTLHHARRDPVALCLRSGAISAAPYAGSRATRIRRVRASSAAQAIASEPSVRIGEAFGRGT